MADDKKNIPEAAPPAEAPAHAVENTAVPEQPAPEPALTNAEAVMLEHEGQAALFEMGEAVPDPADAVTHTEVEEPAAPEVPKAEKEQEQPPTPGKVVDFAAARDEAAKEEKKAVKQKPPTEKDKTAKPGRGRPPKDGKAAPDKAKQPKPRDKKSQSKPAPENPAVDKGGAPAGAEVTPEPSAPRDATRAEKEEIVYLNLSDLHPFKNHPFGVRDDAEMQGLVESVKAAGVNQPALVRPREDGGYEIIAGHRRQRASELAGFANMPCIVRNMTDDEAILAMTDDNLRHRERILPTEKAQSLKMQVEAIKHQGSRPGEEDKDAGKRSTQVVGDRNGMNYKQVQRYIRLTELVPDLQKMVDEKKLAFTPAVEISFIRPKNQRYGRAKVLSDGNTGLSVRTVQGIHLMLHCCFEQAVAENIIPKNPCDNCRLPKKERKEMKFIPPEKVGAYLRAAESEGVLPMFYLELSTGLRRGELLALLWEDVDRENRMISVTKQVTRVDGELVVSQPKTPTSVRKVAISKKTVELLEQEHDRHPDCPYLFPSPVTGGMFSPDRARRIHKRILRKAGIDESIRFHDLRHTFTTMALSGGADPKTISGMLGHTSVDFTMNVYGHFTPQMQRDAAEKVARAMEG